MKQSAQTTETLEILPKSHKNEISMLQGRVHECEIKHKIEVPFIESEKNDNYLIKSNR